MSAAAVSSYETVNIVVVRAGPGLVSDTCHLTAVLRSCTRRSRGMALRMRGLPRLVSRAAGASLRACLAHVSLVVLTPRPGVAAAPALAPRSRAFAAAASPALQFPGGEPDAPRVVTSAIPGPRSQALHAELAAMQDAGGVKFFGAPPRRAPRKGWGSKAPRWHVALRCVALQP